MILYNFCLITPVIATNCTNPQAFNYFILLYAPILSIIYFCSTQIRYSVIFISKFFFLIRNGVMEKEKLHANAK